MLSSPNAGLKLLRHWRYCRRTVLSSRHLPTAAGDMHIRVATIRINETLMFQLMGNIRSVSFFPQLENVETCEHAKYEQH